MVPDRQTLRKFMQEHRRNSDGYRSPTYHSWRMAKARCLQETQQNYPYYGGRGITVCPRWLGKYGFWNFVQDMGLRPEGLTLDRRDPDKDYEPGNCRWATASEQARNKRKKAA